MRPFPLLRLVTMGGAALLSGACALVPATRDMGPPLSKGTLAAPQPDPAEGLTRRGALESEDFIVTFARPGDTPESLAERFLGDPSKAWVVEDYNGKLTPRQEVVIPKRPWNLAGVDPFGYQLVPVLVYHHIAPKARGRLVIAAKAFEEQMRYLKSQRYRVVTLKELYEFISFKRQLPRKAVVLTFDDGYRSFYQYAYPTLKELGFTATLFVYTDFVGAGPKALTWEELRALAREGFDIQAHSKTHGDLRRQAGESNEEYARRMRAELGQPQMLFRRHLGRAADILAYPWGDQDDELIQKVKEFGYSAAFTVRRGGNPSFVYPLRAHRSQIYSEMSLEEFAKNLAVFSEEPAK